jgi:hypothetical protein
LKDHLADVIAKEGTQETAVALFGMVFGGICAQLVGTDVVSNWIVFLVLLVLHQWSNYNLVRTLVLDTLNPQRCYLIVEELLSAGDPQGPPDITPKAIAAKESLVGPLWLAAVGPKLGCSLETLLHPFTLLPDELNLTFVDLQECWAGEPFVVGLDRTGSVAVVLEEGCSEQATRRALFVSLYIHFCLDKQDKSSQLVGENSSSGGSSSSSSNSRNNSGRNRSKNNNSKNTSSSSTSSNISSSSSTTSSSRLTDRYRAFFAAGLPAQAQEWYQHTLVEGHTGSHTRSRSGSRSVSGSGSGSGSGNGSGGGSGTRSRSASRSSSRTKADQHRRRSADDTSVTEEVLLKQNQWDLSEGKQRLGGGPWRLVAKKNR